ncbi:MAG TPA: xanthine dehydrogenase family protein molybdopterin-binding subunit [Gaiellaceae bacterium]|nr:xanthine dehydrogenase family protein molybdopterin-binding subunit [Gaiellaceae bacterium]
MTDARVTGAARYAEDVDLDGQLHARLVRSPFAHARVLAVDTTAVPDGCVTLLPDDVRGLARYGVQIEDETVLALDRVRYVGDVVAAVAGETPREAEEAAALVQVDYEDAPAVLDVVEAVAPGAPLVHDEIALASGGAAYFGMRPQPGTNVCHRFQLHHGDVAAAWAQADLVVEETYRTAAAQHAAMEPHACVARWDGDRLEVFTGTQTPFNLREELARIFGIAPDRVRVVVPPMGGSFGAKTFLRTEAIAAALARKAGRPVKLVLPRAEEWQTLNRHAAVVTMKLGALADGTLLALETTCLADTGAYADCGPGVAQKMGFAAPGPYRIPNVRVDARCVYTNLPPAGAFRGYGQMQSAWARERAVDLLAERLGLDPLGLRLHNLLRDGDVYCTGETMHDVHFAECLEAAAKAIGWHEGRQGKGLSVILKGMQTPSRASIRVEREDGGGFTLRCATTEMGQGARQAITLLAAELLEVEPELIRFPDPDTDVVPFDTRTTSSRSTYMMACALEAAVRDLRQNGGTVGEGEAVEEGGLDPDTGQGIASTHWHQGAASAEVRVDEETGKVEVVRLHCAVYAGRVVNRPGAELQNEGSMIMGLGTALFEEVVVADGQVTNANLSDYPVPSFADLPGRLTQELLEREGAEVHGLGETALPPVPAAIGNAVASLGIQVTELPLTPERVLAAAARVVETVA